MNPKEMRKINKRIKEYVLPRKSNIRVAGRINNKRNRDKRFSRKMRGVQ